MKLDLHKCLSAIAALNHAEAGIADLVKLLSGSPDKYKELYRIVQTRIRPWMQVLEELEKHAQRAARQG